MTRMTRRIDDRERRARLVSRHRLGRPGPATPEEIADALVALHATDALTVYLALWARAAGFVRADLDRALYTDRTLVKHLAMRRTLWVVDREVLAEATGAVGGRVAASERTHLLRDLRRDDAFDDPEGWLDTAAVAIVDALAHGPERTATEIREQVVEARAHVISGRGTRWEGSVPLAPRVLTMLAGQGAVVRGPNRRGWRQSLPAWTTMDRWLGEVMRPPDPHAGHVAMVRRYLRSFGPATETDLVWWLGSTKTAVRAALAEIATAEVEVGTGAAHVLADDLEPVEEFAPLAALLPGLDPTTMGWKERDFYLGPHRDQLFDSAGNGGPTAWWDGRIVGGWIQRDDGEVDLLLCEDVGREAETALRAEAAVLTGWLDGEVVRAAYPSPQSGRSRRVAAGRDRR